MPGQVNGGVREVLTVDGRGRVVYRYQQPFRDGSTLLESDWPSKYLLNSRDR